MKSIIIFCIIFLLFFPFFTHAQPHLIVKNGTGKYHLGKYLEVLEDTHATLTIEDVTTTGASSLFKLNSQEALTYGFSNSAYWVRFTLSNQSPMEKEWFLEIAYPLLDSIDLYIPDNTGKFIHHYSGDRFPFAQRELKYRNVVFPIQLQSGQVKTYYMRFKSESSMIIPINLWTSSAFVEHVNNDLYTYGVYYGIMLAMILYNLFIYFSMKSKAYLYYIFALISFALFQLNLNGFTYQFFWPNWIWWHNQSMPFFMGFTCLWLLIFTKRFLGIPNSYKFSNGFIYLGVVCSLILILLSLIVTYRIGIIFATALSGYTAPLMLVLSIIFRIRGYRPARYFLIAFTAFLLGAVASVLTKFAMLPNNYITENSIQIGSGLQVMLLSFALADRITILRQEKEDAQIKMIEAFREADRMQEQHAHTLERLNKDLESKVKARTAQLETKNIELVQKQQELQYAYEELKKLDNLKSDFISSVSHELRTPLTAIIGFAWVIRRRFTMIIQHLEDKITSKKVEKSIPKVKEGVEIIIAEAEKLKLMINEITDLSNLEVGNDRWDDKLIDASQLILEAIKISKTYRIRNDDVVFDTEIDVSLGMLNVDKEKLIHVINNLISNGFKFTKKGYVKLRAFPKNNLLYIEVEDSGMGLTKENQQTIFENFKQVGDVLTNKPPGLGLGLPISKRIIEHYNGKIWVKSELGKGSIFGFFLPLSDSPTIEQ